MNSDWLLEILHEVGVRWWGARLSIVAFAATAFAGVLFLRRMRGRLNRPIATALIVAALGWGLHTAVELAWIGDDAFISFRYAEHCAAGDGIVFNKGERVEGYTNFLFVLLLAGAKVLGFSVPLVAVGIDLLSFVVLAVTAAALANAEVPTRPGLPWAALAVAGMRAFHVFATSGLETEFALALVALGVLAWRKGRGSFAGTLLGLASTARPDFILVAIAVCFAVMATSPSSQRVSRAGRVLLPALVVFGGWWVWRWHYYGAFFPNTFYAKSGGETYWSQGIVYLVHAMLASGTVWIVPMVVVSCLFPKSVPSAWSLCVVAVAVATTHGLYITRVGGDFMEYRFLLPTMYFFVVAWGALMRHFEDSVVRPWPRVVLLFGCFCLAVMEQSIRPLAPMEKRWHLAAEETFWPVERLYPLGLTHDAARLGVLLRDAFAGTGVSPRIALASIGTVGYFSKLPVTDALGLTSAVIGRKAPTKRSRPGHEKLATPEEMYEDGAVFSDAPVWQGWENAMHITIANRSFWLVRHDESLAALARRRGWLYPDFREEVQHAIDIATSSEELVRDRAFFERILRGTPNADELLRAFDKESIRARLLARAPAVQDVGRVLRQAETFGVDDLAERMRRYLKLRVDFEDDEVPSFVSPVIWPPVLGRVGNQLPVSGYHGARLVNTYVGGDSTKGRLELDLPPGEWLDLLVGGGADCDAKRVALFEAGVEVAHWCGDNSEHLRRVGTSMVGLKKPRLVLIDEDAGPWGHLLLDDVMVIDGLVNPHP